MVTPRACAQDAIAVYSLTISYLHGTEVHDRGTVDEVRAEGVSSNYYYIWRKEQDNEFLTAACIYHKIAKIWTVHLMTGETLSLRDQGNTWEIVKRRPS